MIELREELAAHFGARLLVNEPLTNYTSFAIGGPADLMVVVENGFELGLALSAASKSNVPAFCLGAGTNLLVSDRGIRGLVIRLAGRFAQIAVNGTEVAAGSAAMFGELVQTAIEHGLAGLEFGEGIPGTIGGGLIMNAGAFGGEIARVVTHVHGFTRVGGIKLLSNSEVGFAYRRTRMPTGFVIARVDFKLEAGSRDRLEARVVELKARRATRQPKGLPNAGSIFKNPPDQFAGSLLEDAGLKGERLGCAAFSEQHANFIVNLGGARATDVRALIERAREMVGRRRGIWLEPEVRLVGEW